MLILPISTKENTRSFIRRDEMLKAGGGSGWGLVSSVIWPFFLMFSVKMGKILMLSV